MYVKVIVPVHEPAETYEIFLMAPPDRSFKKTVSNPPVHDRERGEMYFIVDVPFFPLWGGVNAVYKTGEKKRFAGREVRFEEAKPEEVKAYPHPP